VIRCAVDAAKNFALLFHAMADNRRLTVNAARGHDLDRTFEAVKAMSFAEAGDLEGFVVNIAAIFAL
jgi:hypothetical protein